MLLLSGVSLLFAPTVVGHGAIVSPLSRNAVEVVLPWNERTAAPDLFPPPSDKEQPCVCANTTAGTRTSEDTTGCDNAQACFWFSQGCSIGCDKCDSVNGRKQKDLCGSGMVATINEPWLRTTNRLAQAQSDYVSAH
jgi:hypothetical protein